MGRAFGLCLVPSKHRVDKTRANVGPILQSILLAVPDAVESEFILY